MLLRYRERAAGQTLKGLLSWPSRGDKSARGAKREDLPLEIKVERGPEGAFTL